MTEFNLTIGAPSSKRLSNLSATKYTAAPRTNQFEATVNGVPSPAWTTEGKGKAVVVNCYVYFRHDGALYYVKVPSSKELTAARESLVVTTDAWEETQTGAPPRTATKRSRNAKNTA